MSRTGNVRIALGAVELFGRVAVVVPSLHPSGDLLPFIRDLVESGFIAVVVDDGSGPEYAHVFREIETVPGSVVLTHAVNQGKGRALKTGFAYCFEQLEIDGVVTADSDGQHRATDVVAAAESLASSPAGSTIAVLGVRDFDQDFIPRKSAVGNKVTSRVVQFLFGRYFQDTQTGLRGYTRPLLPLLLDVRGERFDYEMNALLRLVHEQAEIKEIPIETVYHDVENSQTHFRPVLDSFRISTVILKQFFLFVSSSMVGAAADILLFTLLINVLFSGSAAALGVTVATVGARVGSALLNFLVNRRAVFQDKSSHRRSMLRYGVLAVGLVSLSACGVSLLAPIMGGHVVWAKLAVDCVLFVVSFLVQKRWVFSAKPTGQIMSDVPVAVLRRPVLNHPEVSP